MYYIYVLEFIIGILIAIYFTVNIYFFSRDDLRIKLSVIGVIMGTILATWAFTYIVSKNHCYINEIEL